MLCFVRLFKNIVNFQIIVGKKKGVNDFVFCKKVHCKTNYKKISPEYIRNPVKTMKLDTPQFKLCITDDVKFLKDLFNSNGYEIRIVGGAVRDLLMGIQPEDLDFATTATPAEMKRIFNENNIRLINTNGEKHGTITSRINDKNYEVTTLRIDLATNGRHAEVEFTKDWILDANRRDLTVNAMYLAVDGTVYDYFNGIEDLKNKRVVFVGDAAKRIQEDYLRILRYFRFYGKIAETPDNHNEDVLQAIRENAEGLKYISGERLWTELIKILMGRFVDSIILKIISLGVGQYIGFPKEPNTAEFKRVVDRLKMKDMTAKPITLVTALFKDEDEFNDFHLRMKLSNLERNLGFFIVKNRAQKIELESKKTYQVLLLNRSEDFAIELLKYAGKFDFLEELKHWELPVFPVNGTMLKNLGIQGRDIGQMLSHLKKIWIDHNFEISAEELLKHVQKKKKKLK